MKTNLIIALALLLFVNISAQTSGDTLVLLPDQNPNFRKSRDKYMQQSAELTANQGTTVQQTYKAIDDIEIKKEKKEVKKELAASRRHERRMARIQSRTNRRGVFGNYNYPYYNNGYYNNYNFNPYGYYSNQGYYLNQGFHPFRTILGTALLGLTIWSIFK